MDEQYHQLGQEGRQKGLREEKSQLNVKALRNKNAICSQKFK